MAPAGGPLGTGIDLTALPDPPTPERVRLGRWLSGLARGSGARPDREPGRDGEHPCRDNRDALGHSRYAPYFEEAFGTAEITAKRVARAIADCDYERTRRSGNSAWDGWGRNGDESAVSHQVKQRHELFFGKARCNQCHLGNNFADSTFHNLRRE